MGIDGYIGWSFAVHLASRGHEVYGIDNFSRRLNVARIGSWSATPICEMNDRLRAAREAHEAEITFFRGSMLQHSDIVRAIKSSSPDAIVHLAEQPSAPYSMMGQREAVYTQKNNVVGTLNLLFAIKEFCPQAHLLKLGTMGEYGTPNIDIPEGFFEIEYRGRKDSLPFPRQAGSFYHLSKVHDSANISLACKLWEIRSTDIMQGVVYGTRIDQFVNDRLLTRFDFDEVFGTALNRFCAQAVIGYPLTPYGVGRQRRGFIALVDSIQCLTLALENPPNRGEYRVFNQVDEVYSINDLAEQVRLAGKGLGLNVEINSVENPRLELEDHYYNVDRQHLRDLGFRPTRVLRDELGIMLTDLMRFSQRIRKKKHVIAPTVRWTGKTLSPVQSKIDPPSEQARVERPITVESAHHRQSLIP